MRLACYGWVDEDGGSVASAGHVVLAELVRLGIEVDLFAHQDHIPRPRHLPPGAFRYFGFAQPRWLDRVDRLPGRLPLGLRKLLDPVYRRSWRTVYEVAVRREHRARPYDAVLNLHTQQIFSVDGVPNVTWLQGPFHTEVEAIRRLRRKIVAGSSHRFYLGLLAYYAYTQSLATHRKVKADCVIVPSNWARGRLVERLGINVPVHALPYPIDLERFSPSPRLAQRCERPMLLWVGRIDPRKRLDLLLEAFPLIKQEVPAARLKIVGRLGYAPGAIQLLGRNPFGRDIEYVGEIPRSEVVPLLREASLLVQPSENENFGSSVAEAQACGTPVVIGPTNGTRDYIDANSSVFASYDPPSLAEAVVQTVHRHCTNPMKSQKSARDSAEKWFSPSSVATRLIEILEGAVRSSH